MRKLAYIFMALCLFAASSCKPVNPEGGNSGNKPSEVTFPSLVEKSVKAGESATIAFTASLDWEVSIPTNMSSYFYISDNGVKEYKVSGKAGSVNVTIAAVELSGVYDEQVCPVTLKMGSKSEVIAKIKLIPNSRVVSVYSAKVNADGSFVLKGDGEYEYSDSKSSSLKLSWPKGLSGYVLPILVDANFEWSIKDSAPKWLDFSATSSSEQSTAILLKGKATDYPLDDDKGTITFLDVQTGQKAFEIEVAIPGCKDIVNVSTVTDNLEFNILGEYNQSGSWSTSGYTFYLTSTIDAEVVALECNDGKYSYNKDSWVSVNFTYPEGQPSNKVVQDRAFHVTVSENHGPDRQAVLLAVPGYIFNSLTDLSKDLVNSNGTIKDAFAKYKFVTVNQYGLDASEGWGAIAPVSTPLAMAVSGAGIERTPSTDAVYKTLSAKFSTTEVYTLSYNNWSSYEDAKLLSLKPFTSCEFMTADGSQNDYNDFLSLEYTDPSNTDMFTIKVEYFEEGYNEVAVLKDGSSVVAVIYVRMTESFWPVYDYRDIKFAAYDMVGEDGDPDGNILPQNVSLEEVKSGDIYNKYSSYGIPVWRLVYKTATSDKNAMIYVPPFPLLSSNSIEINPQPAWIKVESALSQSNKPYIHVSMTDKNPEAGKTGYIVLKGGGRPLFVLICEREFLK